MRSVFFKKGNDKFPQHGKGFFDLKAKDIDGNLIKFSLYKDMKTIIIVNVATKCCITTEHYKQLAEIYKEYQSQGLEILGFPCNQFMGQQSKAESEIMEFATKTFGVNFPLFSKIDVNGPNTNEVYQFLRENGLLLNKNGTCKQLPWNFGKFLVDTNGKVVDFYPLDKSPKDMMPMVQHLLKQ